MKTTFLILAALTQLGGKAAPLTTPYQTEHAWAIAQTATDIAEMGAAARKARVTVVPPPPGAAAWNPDTFRMFVSEQFPPPATAGSGKPSLNVYASLAQLTAVSVVQAGDSASAALQRDMSDARAHESAALVLAAFGLREAANDLSDTRWVLNRLTAHLAVADALRTRDATVSIDGQLARAAFYALADRTATALQLLATIEDHPADQPLMSWKRALRLRLTDDWRTVTPASLGYRLEKLEYFRARRKTLTAIRAGEELTTIKEPAAVDFARIVQSHAFGVEDGTEIVEPAIGAELLELTEVYRLVEHRELSASLPIEIINARAGRLMSADRVRVIPWGAWAEFFQRHIGMYIGGIDRFYRDLYGSPDRADAIKQKLDALFADWTLFPIASARRTKGRGSEADLRYINRAIDLAYRAPELVNYDYWGFLSTGARYEMVSRAMPLQRSWFAAPPSAAVPYDSGVRARTMLGLIQQPALEALVDEVSSDVRVHARALAPRPNNQALAARIRTWFKARAEFDLYAIDAVVYWSRTLEEEIAWRQQGCALSVTQCVSLASLYVHAGDEAKAVAEYEKAFRNPAYDRVRMSNASGWLVSYYERTNQLPKAYDLAQQAADIGSARGLTTLAQLYERRGRLGEAELLYEQINKRYQRSTENLAGFLYRQAIVANRAAYVDRWRAVERQLFPGGLRKVPEAMPEQPAKGVFVYGDSATSRYVRLQAGDIIVGVDGWLVESKDQYEAIMKFSASPVLHKFTAWRGILFTVELPENHGMDLQDHPLKGWIQ